MIASAAMMIGLSTIPSVTPDDPEFDNAPIIQASLDDVESICVVLPAGTYYVRSEVIVPTGKELSGQGRGITTLKAYATFSQNSDRGFTGLIVSDNATSTRVRDMTLDGSKLPSLEGLIKGVIMYRTRDFLVERVESINCNSYSFWACALFSNPDSVRSSGVFRNVRSINANVHFECSNALEVLWDGMEWSGGDGDIACEGVYHALAGSRNITYQNGRQVGPGSGTILYVLANEDSNTENIRFCNCDGFGNAGQVAIQISGGSAARRVNNLEIIDCDVGGTSIGMIAAYASVRVENSRFDFQGNEGVNATGTSTLNFFNTTLKIATANPGATAVPFNFDTSSAISFSGGTLWFNCTAGKERTAYSGDLYMTPATRVVRGVSGTEQIGGESPAGIGSVVKRLTVADQAFSNGNTLDDFKFSTAPNAVYRVRVNGVMTGGGPVTGIKFNSYSGGGGTQRSAVGVGILSATPDNTFTGKIGAITGAQGGDSAAVYGAIGAGKQIGFALEFTLTANGQNFVPIQGHGSGTLLAGATFEIERLS